jgi:hypothetical protein
VTNPENNPFIQLRPCWPGAQRCDARFPQFSPRLAGVALRRQARILHRHDCRSVKTGGLAATQNQRPVAPCASPEGSHIVTATHLRHPFHARSVSSAIITAGLKRIYERYLASQAGFPSDAPTRTFQKLPKLVGTGPVGSTNQGMSVALSADGNTAIVGGPGPQQR